MKIKLSFPEIKHIRSFTKGQHNALGNLDAVVICLEMLLKL